MASQLRKPLPHQAEGLLWARSEDAIALFWEMRLGKTLVAIRWALEKPAPHKLVIAPLTVLRNWQAELALEGQTSMILEGSPDKRIATAIQNPQCSWFLTNYEGLAQRRSKGEKRKFSKPTPVAEAPWDLVILDEATKIRKPTANVTKVALRHLADARFKAILTGLPNPEGPEDYFSQMRFLQDRFMGFGEFWPWQRALFQRDFSGFGWIPKRGSLQRIKEAVHLNANILTRKQAGIPTTKIREVRWVTMPPASRKAYKEAELDYAMDGESTKFAPVKRIWCQRIAGGYVPGHAKLSSGKTEELLDLLRGELKKEQVVVFFRFNAELAGVSQALKLAGIKHSRISGQVGAQLRHDRVCGFKAGRYRVLLCQTTCVKYGLDLSCASTEIFFSNWDEAEIRAQAEDRIVHPQKKETLLVIDLVCEDTVDEDILDALKTKISNARLFQSRLVDNLKNRLERRKK